MTRYVPAQQVRDCIPAAVLHFPSGLCIGTSHAWIARTMARTNGLPGFWRRKEEEKQA